MQYLFMILFVAGATALDQWTKWLVVENMIFNTSLFRKADFERVGGYNENMRTGFEDWDFFLKLIGPDDKVHRIEKVLFYYRKVGKWQHSVKKKEWNN